MKFFSKKRELQKEINHTFINNEIYINDKRIYDFPENKQIELNIIGKDNIIKINQFKGRGNLSIELRETSRCYIEFGKGNQINKGTVKIVGFPQPGKIAEGKCIIGSNNIWNGNCFISIPLNHDKEVKIGNNNLFANGVCIRAENEHLVYDLNTKKQINQEEGIYIGNKIWIGADVTLMNRTKLLDGTVVGYRSIVTKAFDKENILIAGAPAKIRKENISWHMYQDDSYLYTNNPLEQKNIK